MFTIHSLRTSNTLSTYDAATDSFIEPLPMWTKHHIEMYADALRVYKAVCRMYSSPEAALAQTKLTCNGDILPVNIHALFDKPFNMLNNEIRPNGTADMMGVRNV
jgi:poly-beta-hydroxyalkanoate depolymerase